MNGCTKFKVEGVAQMETDPLSAYPTASQNPPNANQQLYIVH